MSAPTTQAPLRVLLVSPALVDEPLGAMYLASSLRAAGFEVRGTLINHGDELEHLVDDMLAWDPQVVAFSVITGEHHQCIAISRQLRNIHEHITVLGGPFLTFVPHILRDHPHLDAVARGDGERTIVELCERIRDGRPFHDVLGFWVRDGDRIVENPLPEMPPIDELTWPDREVFARFKSDGTYNLMASRGCPYRCTYCFNDRYVAIHRSQSRGGDRIGEGPSPVVRYRDIHDVVAEMRELVAQGQVDLFNFHDDIFPLRRGHTLAFCEAYRASGMTVPWSCSIKAELLDEDLVAAMAEAGCRKVYMGVEAGEDSIRRNLLLRSVSREAMIEAARLLQRHGIQLFTQSMVGLPGTSIEDDLETLRFNSELRPTFAWVSIFMPYPGTALADRAIELGLVDDDVLAAIPSTYHHRSVLLVPHADQIGLLHKVFSLGVELPDLLGSIQALVARFDAEDLLALHLSVFLPFRSWKLEMLSDPDAPMPEQLQQTVNGLREGRIDHVRRLIHDQAHLALRDAARVGPPRRCDRVAPDALR